MQQLKTIEQKSLRFINTPNLIPIEQTQILQDKRKELPPKDPFEDVQ